MWGGVIGRPQSGLFDVQFETMARLGARGI